MLSKFVLCLVTLLGFFRDNIGKRLEQLRKEQLVDELIDILETQKYVSFGLEADIDFKDVPLHTNNRDIYNCGKKAINRTFVKQVIADACDLTILRRLGDVIKEMIWYNDPGDLEIALADGRNLPIFPAGNQVIDDEESNEDDINWRDENQYGWIITGFCVKYYPDIYQSKSLASKLTKIGEIINNLTQLNLEDYYNQEPAEYFTLIGKVYPQLVDETQKKIYQLEEMWVSITQKGDLEQKQKQIIICFLKWYQRLIRLYLYPQQIRQNVIEYIEEHYEVLFNDYLERNQIESEMLDEANDFSNIFKRWKEVAKIPSVNVKV